jgi:uncharacterized protein (DUF2252 family)
VSLFSRYRDQSELLAEGAALRARMPVEEVTRHAPAADRADPVKLIAAGDDERVPDLLPLRYERMAQSPFAFLRGSAAVMAADLAGTPVSGPTGHICGDAHASNFGLYASPERRQVMDVNDFDETIVGPWEWDLKRLVASVMVAARSNGLPDAAGFAAARDCAAGYRAAIAELASLGLCEGHWMTTSHETLEHFDMKDLVETFDRVRKKARKNTSRSVAAKITAAAAHNAAQPPVSSMPPPVDHWRFVEDPPILTHVPAAVGSAVVAALDEYGDTLDEEMRWLVSRYSVVDVGHRVVGLGSVGLRSYVVLLHGNGSDPMILQVKQARHSALAPYLSAAPFDHEGKRIVCGQRWMQTVSDVLLGWTTIDGRPYQVRQFRDMKGSIDPTTLKPKQLDDYARIVGVVLARAHGQSFEARLLHGYCDVDGPAFDKAFARFAVAYADQTEADHAAFIRRA